MSPTSSIPEARSSTAPRRTLLHRPYKPGEPADASVRRAELAKTLGIVVLAALMGLTSWVVASVSTWLVPVYVTAMVLIFVMPQVQHLEEPDSVDERADSSTERASNSSRSTSSGLDSLGATTLEAEGLPRASVTGAKPPGFTAVKRPHARGRVRKLVKPGTIASVATTPAAWIRIGPGKFVRDDSRDQGCTSAPILDATLEATEVPIQVAGSPPDLVEETNPTAISIEVDVPTWVDLNEPGPSPKRETCSEDPGVLANPESDSPVVSLVLKADVARQEFDSTAAPVIIAIDGDPPPDLIVAEPVTEEYGIAPSAFGPSPLEAPLEQDHRQGWTDLPDSAGTGLKTPADTGNGNENRCDWKRLKLQSSLRTASASCPRLELPTRLRDVRSKGRRQGFRKLGRAVNCRARAIVQRNLDRSSRTHHGYQPRSPPERS